MADNYDIDESSRLLENSADFRTCSVAKNSCGYTPGHEYCPTVSETLSDGDNKGRDPETDGGAIGTNIDIDMRNCSLAKNAALYTPGNEYLPAHADTISDGDDKGRDPEDGNQHNPNIGTTIDIGMRECLLAKNSDRYTPGNEYCAGNADTIADGDDKGREPEADGEEAGTCIDFSSRTCSLAKNAGLYTKGNEYGAGSGRV